MSIDLEKLNYHSFAKEKISVFISYAWKDRNHPDHGDWVDNFVQKIELLGISPIYDRYDARNSECREFMENGVKNSDFVICICSDEYVERYNKEGVYSNKPGASNEGELITKRIQNTTKPDTFLIPIVIHNNRDTDKKLPDAFPDMFWRNFDVCDSLCAEEFYVLGDILFGIEPHIKQFDEAQERQRARTYLRSIFRGLWLSALGSDEEQKWSQKWNQTKTDSQLSKEEGQSSIQQVTDHNDSLASSNDQLYSPQDIQVKDDKIILLASFLGQWDDSYPGDNDIINDLGGLE